MLKTMAQLNMIEIELLCLKQSLNELLTQSAYDDLKTFNKVSEVYNGVFEALGNAFRAFLLKGE